MIRFRSFSTAAAKMTRSCSIFLVSSLIFVAAVQSQQSTDSRPNIVIIYSDDHAQHAISAYVRESIPLRRLTN